MSANSSNFFDISLWVLVKNCINSFAVSHSSVFFGKSRLLFKPDRRVNSSSASRCRHRGVWEPDCLFSILPGIFFAATSFFSSLKILVSPPTKYSIRSFALSHSSVFCGSLFLKPDKCANSSNASRCRHKGVLAPDRLFSILPFIVSASSTSFFPITL